MKLELKHISPYLPYQLKCYGQGYVIEGTEYDENPKPILMEIEGLNSGWAETFGIRETVSESIMISDCIPILRPLSDLTKEIEVNGERFVPIVELLKIKHKGWYIEKQGSIYCEINFELNNSYAKAYFKYHAIHSIDVWLINLENEPYWVIEKLLEWKFNVFKLPENLYTDINSL